jgi:dipeptidase E
MVHADRDLLDLTVLPTNGGGPMGPWARDAEVLLVDGGDSPYQCHGMRQSGLADLVPSLRRLSGRGKCQQDGDVMTPPTGQYFVKWPSEDRTLGVVDYAIFPHLDLFLTNTLAQAERWADAIGIPTSAIAEETAIQVVDRGVEVVSEGQGTKSAS